MTITQSPENTSVCRGSDVTISCGYQSASVLTVTWIINGTSFDQSTITSNPSSYQLNIISTAESKTFSLKVFSINGKTTFRCALNSDPITISTTGTVTVIGMYVCMYACTYVCMYVGTYIHMYVYTYVSFNCAIWCFLSSFIYFTYLLS